ncbi:hypothetical protein [Cupriavidus sp. UYPR2.512]|uniref:hypothetical protein n=1 Tax=Cupriavidus sp. UYPR2.512 TaxID=1080187 RepID=UPI00036A98B6|nr:hypothetical protein [Cupriavidus sp. UYPR2.512]UIF89364.1 hypothetical protein KAF44_29100 [Cupriavidus necator]
MATRKPSQFSDFRSGCAQSALLIDAHVVALAQLLHMLFFQQQEWIEVNSKQKSARLVT